MKILRFEFVSSNLALYVDGIAPLDWQVGQQLEPFTIPDERFGNTQFPGGFLKSVTVEEKQKFTRYTISYAKAAAVPVPIPMEQPPALPSAPPKPVSLGFIS